jgi:hypothetical protein
LKTKIHIEGMSVDVVTSSQSYLDCLPDEVKCTTDWLLVLKDGEELPCHSQPLCAVSPVLAVNLDLKPREDGLVEIPFSGGRDAADAFLRWTYRLKPTLTPLLAKELAYLSDEWNISGKREKLVPPSMQCSDQFAESTVYISYFIKV